MKIWRCEICKRFKVRQNKNLTYLINSCGRQSEEKCEMKRRDPMPESKR